MKRFPAIVIVAVLLIPHASQVDGKIAEDGVSRLFQTLYRWS